MKLLYVPVLLFVLVGGVAIVLGLPPIERWLMFKPTCFAYVGIRPLRHLEIEPAGHSLGSDLRRMRDRAIAEKAIRQPTGSYVSIVRHSDYAGYTRVMTATQDERGWVVNEAVIERRDGIGMGVLKSLPERNLDPKSAEELSQLLETRCGSPEPYFVPHRPKVWFGFDLTPHYDHPEGRLIEVRGENNNYSVVRGAPVGISGRIFLLLRTPDA